MASTVFSRKLNFKYRDLPAGKTLLLCFVDPAENNLTVLESAVAWKVLYLKAGQIGNEPVQFTSQLAFAESEIDVENTVTGRLVSLVNTGDCVTLSSDVDGHGNAWGKPIHKDSLGTLLKARNKTDQPAAISVGFVTGDDDFNPTFLWKNVGANQDVEAKYHPILSAWVTSDFQQNQFLSADLETDTAIWSQNLADLPSTTTWRFAQTASGDYTITPA